MRAGIWRSPLTSSPIEAKAYGEDWKRQIINAGATPVTDVTPPQYLDLVLEAYNSAITRAFILPIAVAALAFLCSLAFEWKNIKGKKLDFGGGGA